jgi:hypothetical protein
LRIGGKVPWNTSRTNSEDSSFGDVLHSSSATPIDQQCFRPSNGSPIRS